MPFDSSLVATRQALHAVAEHVLAADLYRRTGRIGLRATPGGIGTPPSDVDGTSRRLRIEGTDLVVEERGSTRRTALTTVGAAAEFAGIAPGGPAAVYTLATPLEPDAPLEVDPEAARLLAGWYSLVDAALTGLAAERQLLHATGAQLWPEHFDLALSSGEANYGGSPGDAEHPLPYLYVGPWRPPPIDDAWSEPFGATLTWHDRLDADEAVVFLVDRHDRWAAMR